MLIFFRFKNLKNLWIAALLLQPASAFGNNEKNPWEQAGKVSTEMPQEFKNAGITEKNGDQVDPNLKFTDDNGQVVTLGQYFNKGKPIILSMVYFNCPSLCNLHLNGILEGFKNLDWAVGDKFEVLSVTIDPKENAELAASKKATYLKEYGREAHAGWHFLTGEDSQIKKLAESVGFGYKWDDASQQYAHSSAAIILTPQGKISRYLHGISFDPKTIRLSLVEATNGVIGTIVDSFVLFCFKYDPNKRTYAFYAYNFMKIGAGLCALILFSFLFPHWRKMYKEAKRES